MGLEKPVGQITEKDLRLMIESRAPELKTLEYKETLPGRSDADRREFLADVSSLANAAGGHLVYGMKARSRVAVDLVGVPGVPDDEILRLENCVRDGVAPRIPSVQSVAVALGNSLVAIVLHVAKSFVSPHMVTLGGGSRFYSRSSKGKFQLDVDEIRAAFLATDSLRSRIRDFRLERISRIRGRETPVPLRDGPSVLVHVIPIGAFAGSANFDVVRLGKEFNVYQNLAPVLADFADSWLINFDGLVVHKVGREGNAGYTQIFRNAVIESVDASFISANESHGQGRIVSGIAFEVRLFKSIRRFLSAVGFLGAGGPILLTVDLIDVKGYSIAEARSYDLSMQRPFDRDVLSPEGAFIESDAADFSLAMKPTLDAIWNGGGFAGSPYYADGRWIGNEVAARMLGGV